MKYKEVLRYLVKPFEVEDKEIQTICFLSEIDEEGEVQDKKQAVKLAIKLLLKNFPLTSVSEGGVSLSYDREGVKNLIYSLCKEYGLDASLFIKPTATITRL